MEQRQIIFLAFFLVLTHLIDLMFSLDVTRIDILNSVRHGQPLRMKCVYRLNHREEFKGIRWYKDGDLIFSYATGMEHSDQEPFKFSYNVNYLEIDDDKSDDKILYLDHMLPKFSGRYKCEVRIDEPEFKMKAVSRHIIVARNNSIPKRWNYPVPDEFRDDPDFQDQVEQEDGE